MSGKPHIRLGIPPTRRQGGGLPNVPAKLVRLRGTHRSCWVLPADAFLALRAEAVRESRSTVGQMVHILEERYGLS